MTSRHLLSVTASLALAATGFLAPTFVTYTAGAVLSMAYNEPEVAVDGNVLRIYARLYHIFDDILSTKGKKAINCDCRGNIASRSTW